MVSRQSRDASAWAQALSVGSVGIEMAISVSLGALGGRWLDRRFDTAPAFLLVGFLFGVLLAARALYRVAKRYMRESDDRDDPGSKPTDKSA